MFADLAEKINIFSNILYDYRYIVSLLLIAIYVFMEFFFAKEFFTKNIKRLKGEIIHQEVDSFAMLEIVVNVMPFLSCYIVFHEYIFRQFIIGLIVWIICTVLMHLLAFLTLSDNDRKEFLDGIDNW